MPATIMGTGANLLVDSQQGAMKWLLVGATGFALLAIPVFLRAESVIGILEFAVGSLLISVAYFRLHKPVRKRRKSGATKMAD